MEIIVDSREGQEVWEAFQSLKLEIDEKKDKVHFELVRKQLPIGDIVVGDVVFERKEREDFIMSITDGRMIEQAKNMIAFNKRYIVFVGDIWQTQSDINPRAVVGMQASLNVRYGINFITLPNVDCFAWFVYSVSTKYLDGKKFG